jgi:hypothetical protein
MGDARAAAAITASYWPDAEVNEKYSLLHPLNVQGGGVENTGCSSCWLPLGNCWEQWQPKCAHAKGLREAFIVSASNSSLLGSETQASCQPSAPPPPAVELLQTEQFGENAPTGSCITQTQHPRSSCQPRLNGSEPQQALLLLR